ncbi:MAG: DUF3311 domain-containing protein [Sporichthyaceae bacterium]
MDPRLRNPLLLSIPLWATLFPWFYNRTDPQIAGVPFFYWYQLMWIPLSVLCTVAVYRADRILTGSGTGAETSSGDDRLAGC